MRVNLFTKTQMLSIIRFIAMEYALQNGPEMELYLYSKDGYPLTISPTKLTCFEEKVFEEKLTAKHIILASLYLEEPNVPHLAFVLKINRLLTNQSQMDYSKKIGVDISTYRLIEGAYFIKKGVIKVEDKKTYQFDPENILTSLDIPVIELKYSFGGIHQ